MLYAAPYYQSLSDYKVGLCVAVMKPEMISEGFIHVEISGPSILGHQGEVIEHFSEVLSVGPCDKSCLRPGLRPGQIKMMFPVGHELHKAILAHPGCVKEVSGPIFR